MKQKRQTAGMIQASDVRNPSGKNRSGSANRRELHGIYFMLLPRLTLNC